MISFLDILVIIAPIFVLIGLGAGLRSIRVLTAEADASILKLTINVTLPALAMNVIIGNEALLDPANAFLPPLFGFIAILVGILVSWLAASAAGLRDGARRTFAFCAGIQNYGYVPLPICLALFGRDAAAILFGFALGVELALWLVGVGVLTGRKGRDLWKKALNPPVIAIALGIALNLTGGWQWMPGWVDTTLGMLGACAVPIALMLTGAVFVDVAGLQGMPKGRQIAALGLLVRVAIMPVLILLAAALLPISENLRVVLAIQAAMPAAVAPMAITRHYGGDEQVALRVVLSNTILGILTIPLWLQVGFWILSIQFN